MKMILRVMPLFLLLTHAMPLARDNPQWTYDGIQSVAAWHPQKTDVFLYRFGFTYDANGEVANIDLVITRGEKPGQAATKRSPPFRFTKGAIAKGDFAGKVAWTGFFEWKDVVDGKPVTLVRLDLKTDYFPTANPDGDAFVKGVIEYYPNGHFHISDLQKFEGPLFPFSTTEP